jgi:hypothetical protein
MKKFYRLNIIIFTAAVIALVFSFSAFKTGENPTQTAIADKNHSNKSLGLVNERKTGHNFKDVKLFTQSTADNPSSFFTKASFLHIDKSALREVNSTKPESINFKVQGPDGEITVELVRIRMLKDNFKIKIMGRGEENRVDYKGGLYYQGILKGDNTSIATLSIFDNSVMGIFSTSNGNLVLGSVKGEKNQLTDEYIMYNDMDAIDRPDFVCGVQDTYNSKFYRGFNNNAVISDNPRTSSPVGIFFVCDYQMYLDHGSNDTNVANFVTGVFNHVRTLYQNEQLVVEIADIGVYESADPYRQFSTEQTAEILQAFGDETQNAFPGDLAHLLSSRTPVNGGIAWVGVLCQSYEPSSHSGPYAFSQIMNTYNPYPTFSWTVEVVTHACVWPTNSGQIDSCVSVPGESCVTTTRANPNGTIMSYCHIPQGGGINFTIGFGPMPGDTIRAGYNRALCLDSALNSSETPLLYNLLQNYPNPFNPGTKIQFALPEDGFVTLKMYDLLGREIATLINNNHYPIGIFTYNFDATAYNLASGVYLYKMDVNKDNKTVYSQIKKMVLVK